MNIYTVVHLNLEERSADDIVWTSSSHRTMEEAEIAVWAYIKEYEIDWVERIHDMMWTSEDGTDTIRIEKTTLATRDN